MRKHHFSLWLFVGMVCALLTLLALSTVRSALHDKTLIQHNALVQGYWIARSLEIGHTMVTSHHVEALRAMIRDIEQKPDIQFLMILDANQQVMIASNITWEGTRWPHRVGTPPETGRTLRHDSGTAELVFPAFFADAFQRMHPHHPDTTHDLDKAAWILLALDISDENAHFRASVTQSILVSLGVVILGLAAFWFFGLLQRYRLASASIEHLEHIKHHLARFVPGTVQKLIEDNPERPLFDKVEREVTVLFLDIDHYTTMAAELAPEALNHLIETYFSAFLDIVLSHGGEINETAGDGIMAIFTGTTAQDHARNAVEAALSIQQKAAALNRDRALQGPDILVNIGISTGPALLGATRIKGAVGERLTYTASGMVTNIAARLCDLGHQGESHCSDTTAQLVSGRYTFRGPCEVHLKHIPGVTRIYKVEGVHQGKATAVRNLSCV